MIEKKMNRMSLKKVTVILLFVLCIFLKNDLVHADEVENNVNFNIQAILPGNQIDKNSTYFDLKMKPGQKQTIEFMLNNTGDNKKTYEISVNQAYTNAQGFIDYSKQVKPDESQKYPIKDIITYEKEITVEGQSSEKVPLEIQMPEEVYDGQIMAAIQVVEKDENEGAGVGSKVGYLLGLNLTETDTEVKREIQLVSIEPAVFNSSTSVKVALRNPTMDAIGHLKYVVNITDKKTKKNVRSVTYDSDMQLAPNSTYDFSIEWEGKRLVAGEYNLNLVVSDAKSNEWKFDEDFAITPKQAKEINDLTVDVATKNHIPVWIFVVIGVALLLVISVIVYVVLKNQKKKQSKKNKKSKKRKKTSNHKRKKKKENS